MSVIATVITANFPLGNPGSVGEPLGQVVGEADVTGDATGGTVILTFNPQNPTDTPGLSDQRREHIYFIDDLNLVCTADPGFVSAQAFSHGDRANTALATRHRYTRVSDYLSNGSLFLPEDPLWSPELARAPFFWRPQELLGGFNTWIQFQCTANVDAATYVFRLIGRYYDKSVLANRGFGRLISPEAVSQFEG